MSGPSPNRHSPRISFPRILIRGNRNIPLKWWQRGNLYWRLPIDVFDDSPIPAMFLSSPSFRRLALPAMALLMIGSFVFFLQHLSFGHSDLDPYSFWREGGLRSDSGPSNKFQWGWTESMGWVQDERSGLRDLGKVAEGRYRLNVGPGEEGKVEFFTRLYEFADSLPTPIRVPLINSIHTHLPPTLHALLIPFNALYPRQAASMISYKNIHQTDKSRKTIGDLTQAWVDLNDADGWQLNFMDDVSAWRWVQEAFGGSAVEWAWQYMHRGVLRADFLRYLLPLVQGGVYSDMDTQPLRPIEHWGQLNVEYLDLTETDGKAWRSTMSTYPAVMVAVDVDVHSREWEKYWPRAFGICQWTLSSAPYHPIFLDAVRRVVNATRVVEEWEHWRSTEILRIKEEAHPGWRVEMKKLSKLGRINAMEVMEWTGPGLFTDAVLAFLLVRYNVTWHRLRGLDHPLRIGDVMILPITAFSPGGDPDFGAEGPNSPQANVIHKFRASWKSGGL